MLYALHWHDVTFNLAVDYTVSQKERAPYNNVNNLFKNGSTNSFAVWSPTRSANLTHSHKVWSIYLENEDSGEFSARKGCSTQWPSWIISTSVTKSHCRPIVLFHDVAFHDVARSRFVLSALAYLSQTADRPVVD